MYWKVWKSSENGLCACNVYFFIKFVTNLKVSLSKSMSTCAILLHAWRRIRERVWLDYIIDWNYPFLILLINSNLNISKTESQENLDTTLKLYRTEQVAVKVMLHHQYIKWIVHLWTDVWFSYITVKVTVNICILTKDILMCINHWDAFYGGQNQYFLTYFDR